MIFRGLKKKDKKKPAAFYFRRSATPTLPSFASLRFAKLAAVPRRVRERPSIRLPFSGKDF